MNAKTINFQDGYPDWESACRAAVGYDADAVILKTANAARAVARGDAVYERDSVIFDEIQYSWPMLASLMTVAADKGRLDVLDFGGALGTTYRQVRKFVGVLGSRVSWNIVEQDRFVSIGRSEFETESLLFFNDANACLLSKSINVFAFLGSIQYVDNPYVLLDLAKTACDYVLFDRIMVHQGLNDRFSVQVVRQPIYDASYPVRTFSEKKLLDALMPEFELLESWLSPGQPDPDSQQKGFFFHRRVNHMHPIVAESCEFGAP